MTRECEKCRTMGYEGKGSCEWTRLGWKGYFHHPDEWDNYHDLLMPVYDTRNTRMIANLVNLGFDIRVVGMAYEYMKETYYSKGWTTEMFHDAFDSLRCILEDTRFQCLFMMQESPALKTHYCDLARMQQSSNHIRRRAGFGWDSDTCIDFLNDFMHLLIDHTQKYFPDSYISKTIQKDPLNKDFYDSLIATLPEEERKEAWLFRSNRKKSWRLVTIDLPALMWQTVRMRCAEKRMDDEYAEMEKTESWAQYFDSKIKEDSSPQTIRLN